MEPFDLLHLSSREKEILEFVAFKFIPYEQYSYYRYAYSSGGYGKRSFSEEEFQKAVDYFNNKGWYTTICTYSRKGEIEKGAKFLHPVIWLEVLKTSRKSNYLKVRSSWSDYQTKALLTLLGEKKADYIDAVGYALEYEQTQPLATYLIWSLFDPDISKSWLRALDGYRRAYLEWQMFQMAYSAKIATSTAFLFYKKVGIEVFRKSILNVYKEGSENQEQIQDNIRLGWDFVINGSAQAELNKCFNETGASYWIYAAGLLRQKEYKKAFQSTRSAAKQKSWCSGYRSALEDLIYGLALYHNRDTASATKKIQELELYFHNFISDMEGSIREFSKQNACSILLAHLCLAPITSSELTEIWNNFCQDVEDADRRAFFGLLMGYLGLENAVFTVETILNNLPTYSHLIESELYSIKKNLGMDTKLDGKEVDESNLFLPMINDIEVKKDWEIALDQLSFLNIGTKSATARVIYLFNDWSLSVRQQKYGRNGWGAFNNLSAKAFLQGLPFMDDVDRQISAIASTPNFPNWNLEAIKKLAGSNRVYDFNDPSTRISIEEVKLEIGTKRNKDNSYTFTTNIPLNTSDEMESIPETDGTWWNVGNTYFYKDKNVIKFCQLTDEQKKITDILLKVPSFPSTVKNDLTRVVEAVSKTTTVMSDLLEGAQNLPTIKGISDLTVRISPEDEYFDVKAIQCLVENANHVYLPGVGSSPVSAVVDGRNVLIERDLKKEKENLQKFMDAVEPFNSWQYADHSWQLELPDMLEMLEVIRELGSTVRIEWPEGVEYKVKKPVRNYRNFSISTHERGYWFDVGINLEVDKDQTLNWKDLLEKLKGAKGRFIQLEGNEFIALNEKLMKQLKTLEQISSKKGNDLALSRYSIGYLKALQNEGVKVESDGSYENLLDRIEKASDLQVKVPKTFKGELRGYQEEGYEWMSKLASWEAGGILADDMGLGKTIQAIALLGEKKKEGPSLVVCPAAVLINWQNELRKFDPSLKVHLMNKKEGREEILKEAKAGDVIVTTYGVLSSEVEAMTKVEWNQVVLDEAHSIKNRATQMSKAVQLLKSKGRFLLTGTPIQNHLGEIWNLMEFANPGLLGSSNSFKTRFEYPIQREIYETDPIIKANLEREKKEAQTTLRKLIAPFILRRTKEEVEEELPPRTEMEIKVSLSQPEKELYAALNLQAQEEIERGGRDSYVSIFAHLTKLRQAACSPALVDPKLNARSSKTEAFLDLAQRLISEGHRALVFSQFTTHLAIIKKELDAIGIPYLYMDGSNTPAERDKLKKAFQEGDTPLFLISLKAGGIGMNLTAADYVIHLDPWWNPAIEDQASDRAHRIGQDKPVYIYRLISEGTIEEKILTMHKTKKTLADDLLEGSDISAKLTKDEILELLKSSENF